MLQLSTISRLVASPVLYRAGCSACCYMKPLAAPTSLGGSSSLEIGGSASAFPSIATAALSFLVRGGSIDSTSSQQKIAIAAGGAAAATGLDISRVRMRLEGFQAYGTLCALMVNACLRLYSSVKIPHNNKEGDTTAPWTLSNVAMDVFLLSVIVSVLFGSYGTIAFSLMALFSKTALARGRDAQFLEFFAATADIRQTGFESFVLCLVSFETAFILSLFLRFQGQRRRRNLFVTLACVISCMSVWRWSSIMRLAGEYLFPLRAEVSYF